MISKFSPPEPPGSEDLREDPLLKQAPREDGRPALRGLSLLRRMGGRKNHGIYFAHHPRLRRGVVLKVLRVPSEITGQFLAYGQKLARVSSQHVVEVIEVQTDDPYGYVAMQYVTGVPADDAVSQALAAQRPGLENRDALPIMAAVIDGLQRMHKRGVCHGAVHPGNVLIPWDEKEQKLRATDAKLSEPGLAQLVAELTSDNEAPRLDGRRGFTAPEVMSGQAASVASDIYGLGATFYYLLTARRPGSLADEAVDPQLNGHVDWDSLVAGLSTQHAPPSQSARLRARRRDVDPSLVSLIARCLRRQPEKRPESVEEVQVQFHKGLMP
jgi:serine/threonine-protein kinase